MSEETRELARTVLRLVPETRCDYGADENGGNPTCLEPVSCAVETRSNSFGYGLYGPYCESHVKEAVEDLGGEEAVVVRPLSRRLLGERAARSLAETVLAPEEGSNEDT